MITYNHQNYIKQALESVLNQKVNFDYEIIIGDDASFDGTSDIILDFKKKYKEKIVAILREENIGATNNFYNVMKNAKGKYIALLEGDDFWTDNFKLQTQYDFLENNYDFIGVAHKNGRCDGDGNIIEDYPFPKNDGILTVNDFLKYGILYHTSTLFFKNIFVNSDNRYMELLTSHPLIGDIPLAMLLLDMGNMYLLNKKMSMFRRIVKKNGTNAQSIAKSNLMRSMTLQIEQTRFMDSFFRGKYNFNSKLSSQVAFLWLTFIPGFSSKSKQDIKKARFILSKIDYKIKVLAFLYYFKKILKKLGV